MGKISAFRTLHSGSRISVIRFKRLPWRKRDFQGGTEQRETPKKHGACRGHSDCRWEKERDGMCEGRQSDVRGGVGSPPE